MTDPDTTLSRAQHLLGVAESHIACERLLPAANRLERAAALLRQAFEERQVDPANLMEKKP